MTTIPGPAARPSGRIVAGVLAVAAALTFLAPAAARAAEPIANTGQPGFVSDMRVGSTVTALPGEWTPEPTAFDYEWYLDDSPVATGETYTLAADDVDRGLMLKVTAHLDGYEDTVAWSEPAAVLAGVQDGFTTAISGRMVVGSTVTATVPSEGTVSVRWLRDGARFSGGTAASYVVRPADAGHTLSVVVTRALPGFTTATATATASTRVLNVFEAAPKPTVSGRVRAGSTLTAVTDGAKPSDAKRTYQWFRDGVAIAGATKRTLALKNVDAGKTFSVTVTYAKSGYAKVTRSSATTKAAAARPKVAAKNGYYRVGKDFQPGTYYRTGSSVCEWYRLSGKDIDVAKNVRGNNGGLGRVYLQVKATDTWIHVSGCGGWTRFDGTGAQRTSIGGNGTYAVGADIKPGTYTSDTVSGFSLYGIRLDWCFVGVESRPLGTDSSAVDFWIAESGPIEVKARSGQFLTVWGCGTLTRTA
ncbi:hypothetical protein [Demequina iriomotensis]|uniref:hypothetical protein n=1 Tax=Demequina iriomotensis TaxID=1536641 RepID=UPI0007838CDE|nr:hypothetical protein [Demequina iriomotensis]